MNVYEGYQKNRELLDRSQPMAIPDEIVECLDLLSADEQFEVMLFEPYGSFVGHLLKKVVFEDEEFIIRDMAQLDGFKGYTGGCYGVSTGLHEPRLIAAAEVFFEGCKKDDRDTCTTCADFVVRLCEIKDAKMESNE